MNYVHRSYYEMRKILSAFRKNVRDVITLGSGFSQRRYVALARGQTMVMAPTRHYGSIYFRLRGSDTETIREILSLKAYDFTTYPQWRSILGRYQDILANNEVPVIIDAGANIGIASIWFATQFPEARIVAIEPDVDNVAIARCNTASCNRVSVVHGAVGAETGYVSFQKSEMGDNAGQTVRGLDGIRVYTIDEMTAGVERGRLFVAKVDIEGFEKDLFESNLAWIDQATAVIVEPHDWLMPGKDTSSAFRSALARSDFELLIHQQNLVFVRVEGR